MQRPSAPWKPREPTLDEGSAVTRYAKFAPMHVWLRSAVYIPFEDESTRDLRFLDSFPYQIPARYLVTYCLF